MDFPRPLLKLANRPVQARGVLLGMHRQGSAGA